MRNIELGSELQDFSFGFQGTGSIILSIPIETLVKQLGITTLVANKFTD